MTTIIKIGGALVANDRALETLWRSVKAIENRVVIVHGGGPRATEIARKMGHEPRIVHGRRVTGDLDLAIVQWSMRGELNSRLVAAAFSQGVQAVGVSGADGGILCVVKRPPWIIEGEEVDFGWVGDVEEVNPSLLNHLLDGGFVPVVAPMGIDADGRLFNVNADTVSYEIASALGAREFLLVTESGGVRADAGDPRSLLASFSSTRLAAGVEEGWIQGGMRVKLKVAFDALEAGIPDVYVVPPEGILNRTLGTHIIH